MSDKKGKMDLTGEALGDSVELFNDIFSEEPTEDLADDDLVEIDIEDKPSQQEAKPSKKQPESKSRASKGKAKPSGGRASKGKTAKSSGRAKKKGKQPPDPSKSESVVKKDKVKKGKRAKKSSDTKEENPRQKGLEIPLQAKPKKRTNPLMLILLFVVLVTLGGFLMNYFGIVDFKKLTGSAIGSSEPVKKDTVRLSITKKGKDKRVAKKQSTVPKVKKTEKRTTKRHASLKTPKVKKGQDRKAAKKLRTPTIVKKPAKDTVKTHASLKTPKVKKGQDRKAAKKLSTPTTVKKPAKNTTKRLASLKTAKVKKGQDKKAAKKLSTPTTVKKPAKNTTKRLASLKTPNAKKGPEKKISGMNVKASSYPYSVYLGSFRTMKGVHRTVVQSRKYGLSPYWIKIDLGEKGTWFRIFAGYFETRKGADDFIKVKRIGGAASRHTKYANLIGNYTSAEALDRKQTTLLELGYSPYVINDKNAEVRLYVGAFYQLVRAEKQNAALAAKGIQSRLVRR
jgi:hypothetical protein